jgi:hypothetical protein
MTGNSTTSTNREEQERMLSFLVIDSSSLSIINSIKRETIRPGHGEAVPRRLVYFKCTLNYQSKWYIETLFFEVQFAKGRPPRGKRGAPPSHHPPRTCGPPHVRLQCCAPWSHYGRLGTIGRPVGPLHLPLHICRVPRPSKNKKKN